MRWRDEDQWVRPDAPTHPPLVTPELTALGAGRIAVRIPGRSRPRVSPYPYALRGIIFCARCGSRMQGAYRPSKAEGPGRVLYRCEAKRSQALPLELADHPWTLYVNQSDILQQLDPWIEAFAAPAWLAESQTADPVAVSKRAGPLSQLRDLDRRINSLIAAIESGDEVAPLIAQLAKRTAERDALKVRLGSAAGPAQIDATLEALGGLTQVLQHATAQERAAVYHTLQIQMHYDDRARQVRVTADLSRVAGGVGGGTCNRGPRHRARRGVG